MGFLCPKRSTSFLPFGLDTSCIFRYNLERTGNWLPSSAQVLQNPENVMRKRESKMSKTVIHPQGWLKNFLEMQNDGLTGNIEAAGAPFDQWVWGNPDYLPEKSDASAWWPCEQTGYWIDGFTRMAVLLEDAQALRKASDMIYAVIDHPDKDSYLGPSALKKNGETVFRWPHVVFFRACMALYGYNGDVRIPEAIAKHYLNCPYDYSSDRDVLNVEIMLWVYGIVGDKRLLRLAEDSYAAYNAKEQKRSAKGDSLCDKELLSDRKMFIHGVSYNEYMKLGAILYRYTGKELYLDVSVKAARRLNRYYKLPGGCISSTEFTFSNHYDESAETCDVSDYTWSLSYLLAATNDIRYADDIERCVFNAGIGAVTEDFRALQYFSCGNQLVLNEQSNHNRYFTGNKMMAYSPHPGTACCPGNVNRFMPNYILNMWRVSENRIYADLLGPSAMEAEIPGGTVSVVQETRYPFENKFVFRVSSTAPAVLYVRIPSWTVKMETDALDAERKNGYLAVPVDGSLEFSVVLEDCIERHRVYGGVYFSKGPLVYSLGMKGVRTHYEEETVNGKEFPSYRMMPDKDWNYAFTETETPVFTEGTDTVWDLNANLPCIRVPAKKVIGWRIHPVSRIKCWTWRYEDTIKKGKFLFTPKIPSMKKAVLEEKEEQITLYPYGASKVRMTVLPTLAEDNSKKREE